MPVLGGDWRSQTEGHCSTQPATICGETFMGDLGEAFAPKTSVVGNLGETIAQLNKEGTMKAINVPTFEL